MRRCRCWIGLLMIALLFCSCATVDQGMGSMKKSFPGRTDNTVK